MKLFFILGNQLFPLKYLDRFKKDHVFFMAEDNGLCTYEKHHKQKILLFLSSMRSYADNLKKNKLKLDYLKIEDKDFKDDYFKKLKKIIIKNKITEISSFEVEDKFFEKKIKEFLKKEKINWNEVYETNLNLKVNSINKIRQGLLALASSNPRYQCGECGFSSLKLLWQCPSCKDWETQRPFLSVKFDSLLQRKLIDNS